MKSVPASQSWAKVRPVRLSQSYYDYMQSDKWKELRREKLTSNPPLRCEACGYIHGIECHHLIYRIPLESAQAADLMLLCRRCHQWTHEAKDARLLVPGQSASARRNIIIQWIKRKLLAVHGDSPMLHRKNKSEASRISFWRRYNQQV